MGAQENTAVSNERENDGFCVGHKFFEQKIDTLVNDVKDGFKEVNAKMETMLIEQATTNQSLKSAWHDINEQGNKIDAIPKSISDAIAQHASGCPIRDVTEVGIKTPPRRGKNSDTPPRGTPRPTSLPTPSKWTIGVGIGVIIAAALLGLFLGVWMMTGSTETASNTVRKVVGQDTTVSNDTGDGPKKAVSALTGG